MENGVVNMAHALEPLDFEIHFACLERRGAFADRLPHPHRVSLLGKHHGFSPLAVARLTKLILKLRPNLIHTHNLGPLIYSSLATVAGSIAPITHGEHSQLSPADLLPHRLRQRRWLYRSSRSIHTVSRPMQAELLQLGFPPEKISVIPNGVDSSLFTPANPSLARLALGLPTNATCIGIVGRFGPFKQHHVLLEAFHHIAPQFPSLHLVIAGTGGPRENPTRSLVDSSPLSHRIHWLGFQSNPASLYPALDLTVIPSLNEGFSNVALESLSSGVPVLANLACGHEEFIADGLEGRIADLSSPLSLASQVASLLTPPSPLAQWGANARAKVLASFSLSKMAHAYASHYQSHLPSP